MRRHISIRGRVRPSVRPSVCPVLFLKVKSTHTGRILCRVSGLVLSTTPLVLRVSVGAFNENPVFEHDIPFTLLGTVLPITLIRHYCPFEFPTITRYQHKSQLSFKLYQLMYKTVVFPDFLIRIVMS